MDLSINEICGLGYSVDDYKKMFDLSDDDLNRNILDYRSGANVFCQEIYNQNKSEASIIKACDPIYQMNITDLKKLAKASIDKLNQEYKANKSKFTLNTADFEKFIEQRINNINIFFSEFEVNKNNNLYTLDSLPSLSFEDEKFDLALVNYYFFSYSEILGLDYIVAGLKELIRVANEVRIFPLVNHSGEYSDAVPMVLGKLQENDLGAEIKEVEFGLWQSENAMMKVWSPACSIQAHSVNEND